MPTEDHIYVRDYLIMSDYLDKPIVIFPTEFGKIVRQTE